MKNSNIHHIIGIKAGTSDMIDYNHPMMEAEKKTSQDWIKLAHSIVESPGFSHDLHFHDYDEMDMLIGEKRDWTKEDYKKVNHELRHNYWLQYGDQTEEDFTYEPDLNPGGGPYHM